MIDFSNVSELFVAGKEARDLYINGSKVWEKSGPQPTIPGLAFTNNFDPSWTTRQWLDGTASTGTLHYNGSDTTRGSGAIPNGWNVVQF